MIRSCYTRLLTILILFFSFAVLFSAGPAQGQVPALLVKDMNIETTGVSSNPIGFVTLGETTFFAASTASRGHELWKTDGTEAGTVMVKDIRPGSTSSGPVSLSKLGDAFCFAVGWGRRASKGRPRSRPPAGD